MHELTKLADRKKRGYRGQRSQSRPKSNVKSMFYINIHDLTRVTIGITNYYTNYLLPSASSTSALSSIT